MVANDINPLTMPPPAEVPLVEAPLVRVIAQVRFPLVVAIERQAFIASFQEAIRDTYPILRPEQTHNVVLAANTTQTPPSTSIAWRFHDAEKQWSVSLTPTFISLETVAYRSRDDFLNRWQPLLLALEQAINPQYVDRLGLRYVDQLVGIDSETLKTLVQPALAGISATPLADHAEHALSETLFTLPDSGDRLFARWGQLPPNATVDPAVIEPVAQRSWLLDLDMHYVGERPLTVVGLMTDTRRFAERIYTVFRWAVTDAFLRRYGGEL